MMDWKRTGYSVLIGLVAAVHCAAAPREEGRAFVTVQLGPTPTRGVGGTAFPDGLEEKFSRRRSSLKPGDAIVTHEAGRAVLSLPAYGLFVRLGSASHLKVDRLPAVDNRDPASLLLLDGTALVVSRTTNDRWLSLRVEAPGQQATLLSKGAVVAASVDSEWIGFAVTSGEAFFRMGAAAAGPRIDEQGNLIGDAGTRVVAGQQVRVAPDAVVGSGVPPVLSHLVAEGGMGSTAYQFGLRAGEAWVSVAEKGDLTPFRIPGGAAPAVLPEAGLEPQYAFDQARAGLVVQTPRTVRTPTRAQGANPVRALLSSGLPSEVVVGRRIVTARFLGIRGGIRINPSIDPLIKLAGRPGR